MALKWFALIALAFSAAAPLSAEDHVQPAVQPGGDIPPAFRHATRASPANSDQAQLLPPSLAGLDYLRRKVRIPMRDGKKLYAVLIIPRSGRGAAGSYPVMLDRTPYSADAATGDRVFGPRLENILSPLAAELVRAGYIVAYEDVRGKYKSEGDYVMNRPLKGPLNPTAVDHSTDTWDTIDWLVKNVPESNGRVGTFGTSYDGFTTLMSLVNPHPALKAAVPINPMVDVWKDDDWFHNGAFRQEMIDYIYNQTETKGSSENRSATANDDYDTFLRLGSAGSYGSAIGMDQLPFWRRLSRHPAYDEYWKDQAVDRILAARSLTVPTLLVAGEWDQEDIYGAPAVFEAIKNSGNAYLVLGPWYHGEANVAGYSLGALDWGSDTSRWFRQNLLLPFLDQYLKNGPRADIARVTAFEVGTNKWKRLDDWPEACARDCATPLTPIYLVAGGRLSFARPESVGSSSFTSDPARPVTYRQRPIQPTYSQGSTWRQWLVDDQRFAEARPDVLTFSGEPLRVPLHLAGTPFVHLVASTSGTDSDWIVKLIDVYPATYTKKPELDGYELPIAMDIIRGRYRGDPAHPAAVPANQAVTYEFALPNVDYVVEPGHRLMVQVQSSWFPLYDRNPQNFVPNIFFAKQGNYQAATQRVFTGSNGSFVGLPSIH